MTSSHEKPPETNWGAKAKSGTVWVVVGFGGGQLLRLGSNIVLAALLYEEVFALMGIVSTLIVGLSMLSDIGLKPSVVQHARGDQREFLNTVWTIQIIRALLIYSAVLILTIPITRAYGANDPAAYELYYLIPLIGLTVVFDGLHSSRMLSAERHLSLARLTKIEVVVQITMSAMMIGLAWYTRSVYALAVAAVVSSALRTFLTYTMLPGGPSRLAWDRDAVRDVVRFGKWIFVSTCLSFLTLQADRLLISGFFPLAEVGVYFMAVSLAMLVSLLVGRLQTSVIFPWYARMIEQGIGLPAAFQKTRMVTLVSVSYMVCMLFVGAAPFFDFAYDDRYAKAGVYLPVLATGAWFSCLADMYGAAFLVLGKSKWAAISAVSKLLVLAIGFPLVLMMDGSLLTASLVVVGGDVVRAVVSQWLGYRVGVLKLKVDVAMVLMMLSISAAGYWLINHAPGISDLHPLIQLVAVGAAVSLLFLPFFIRYVWPLFKGRRAYA